jgi:hypothetical protein
MIDLYSQPLLTPQAAAAAHAGLDALEQNGSGQRTAHGGGNRTRKRKET